MMEIREIKYSYELSARYINKEDDLRDGRAKRRDKRKAMRKKKFVC